MYIMNNYFDTNTMNFDKTTGTKSMKEENFGYKDMGCCDMQMSQCGMVCDPIHECPQERVCHRYINYEVPHIIPCNTRIINHHIYRHTYTPCFSSCEENVCANVYDGRCC